MYLSKLPLPFLLALVLFLSIFSYGGRSPPHHEKIEKNKANGNGNGNGNFDRCIFLVMAFPSSFWQPVGIKKVLSAEFKLFRTVSDHFRIVPDRFQTVFGSFQIVSDRFRTVLDEGATTAQEKRLRAKNLRPEGLQTFCESVCDDRARTNGRKSDEKQECS